MKVELLANPKRWANYIAASAAMNRVTNDETPMGRKLKSKIYVNDRCPGKVKFVNTAKTRIGERDLINRLSFLHIVNWDWIDKNLSKDALRVALKS